ncbi:MAG: DUF1707 SHOCT-like domain-containing protein [Gaiellaceae bacterium]
MSEPSLPAVRASDADRDRIASALRDHLVAGRLTLEEFTERVAAAQRARTLGELEELTRDLPAAGTAEVAVATAPGSPSRWSIAFMSEDRLDGRWRAGEHVAAVAIMGKSVVDLRHARLDAAEIVVTAIAHMGDVTVIVPEGVEVDVSGFALMGSKRKRTSDVEPLPGAPRVHVRAFVLMGEVTVRSESRKGMFGFFKEG